MTTIDQGLVAEATEIQRSNLWLTSRSLYERGTQYCAFARYIENHAGPYGYGFSRKARSLPLVTGSYSHLALTDVLQWCLDARKKTGTQPTAVPDAVIRWACFNARETYRKVCEKRGILKYTQDNPEALAALNTLITEQEFLIEGLAWVWCKTRLPIYLRDYLIIEIEGEQEYVIDCSCGLGNGIGSFEEHELRGCSGIGIMAKPDILGQRLSDGQYGYTEFKTAGVANKGLNDSWERKPQFILGMLGAERKYGVEVSHAWVETLIKGKREKEPPYDKGKIQRSPLCYSYYAPPNPPMSEARWRPGYNYFTATGDKLQADKKSGFRNTPLWGPDISEAWPGLPMIDQGDGTAELMTISEYWVTAMANEYPYHVEKQISLIGPLPRNDQQIEKALRGFLCEERLWKDRLWKIYEFAEANGVQWGDDLFHEFLELTVPRSWKCDPFAEHPCSNQPICHPITEDWRKPIESELFVYRVPHHGPEVDQMKRRGLIPEGGELAEEEGEQEEID